jgi:HD-GYP domain-containing protein (c-di-GMP phosphodiesterase class II)
MEAVMDKNGTPASAATAGDSLQHASSYLRSRLHIQGWPKALELEGWPESLYSRNKETEAHTLCVAEMTVKLARLAGLPESEITYMRYGALLHDIGKVGIPDAILLKPGKLSRSEWDVIRKHPGYGYELIYPVEYFRPCFPIPYAHHEKWDGTGYPRGLKGEQIPLAARLFAIADVWDTLSSNVVYREAWPQERVIEYIQHESGTHFDPRAVELFLRAINEMTQTGSGGKELPTAI